MLSLRRFAPAPPTEPHRGFLQGGLLAVGDAIAGAANPYVLKIGDTMTGDLLPSPTSTLKLGSQTLRWQDLFLNAGIRDGSLNYRVDVGQNSPTGLKGAQVDGAAAVGVYIDTTNSFATGGSKLLSIRNAGVELLYVNRLGSPAPVGDGTVDFGGTANRWLSLHTINIRANTTTNRLLLSTGANGGNAYRGEVTTGSTTAAHTFANANTLSTTGDKIASFWAGNASGAEKVYVTKDGSLVPAVDSATSSISLGAASLRFDAFLRRISDGSGTPVVRFDMGGGSFNQYRGAMADSSSAYGHKFICQNALTTSGSKIAGFFSDDATTERLFINRLGSTIPGNDGVANLGSTSARWLGTYTRSIRDTSDNLRLDITNTENTYRSAAVDGASALGHVFDTVNSFATGGSKLLSIRNAGTEKIYVAKDGSIVPAADLGRDLGAANFRFQNVYSQSYRDYAGNDRIIFNGTVNSRSSYVSDEADTLVANCHSFDTYNALTSSAAIARFGQCFDGVDRLRINQTGRLDFDTTDSSGTPGAVTINKPSGKVAIASGVSSVVVTNSCVTAGSTVLAVLQDNTDAISVRSVVPAAGSFTINLTGATTAARKCAFFVLNQ